MVVFTGRDDLDREGISIQEFVKNSPMDWQNFLRKCQERYIAVNNMSPTERKETDVQSLLNMIETVKQQNNETFYTNETFIESDKAHVRKNTYLQQQQTPKQNTIEHVQIHSKPLHLNSQEEWAKQTWKERKGIGQVQQYKHDETIQRKEKAPQNLKMGSYNELIMEAKELNEIQDQVEQQDKKETILRTAMVRKIEEHELRMHQLNQERERYTEMMMRRQQEIYKYFFQEEQMLLRQKHKLQKDIASGSKSTEYDFPVRNENEPQYGSVELLSDNESYKSRQRKNNKEVEEFMENRELNGSETTKVKNVSDEIIDENNEIQELTNNDFNKDVKRVKKDKASCILL